MAFRNTIVNLGILIPALILSKSFALGPWTDVDRTLSLGGRVLNGITWTGKMAVAVGNSGEILTSEDGIAWDKRNSGLNVALKSVTSNETTIWVVGDNGTVLASSDGATWKHINAGITVNLNSICWTGIELVTVGDSGAVYTTIDGVTWTKRESGTIRTLYCAYSHNGTTVIAGDSATLLTSNNDITWKKTEVGKKRPLHAVVWAGDAFITAGEGAGYLDTIEVGRSTDGVTWTLMKLSERGHIFGSVWNGQTMVLVGYQTWPGGQVNQSDLVYSTKNDTTGVYRSFVGYDAWFNSVTWTGSAFLAVGWDGKQSGIIYSSTDLSSSATNIVKSRIVRGLSSIAWSGKQFVAVGDGGEICSSTDGNAWHERVSGSLSSLSTLVWAGNQFIAFGESGTVLASPDGQIWTKKNIPTICDLNAAAWGNGVVVAIGNMGGRTSDTIFTTVNGVNWSKTFIGTSALMSVAWADSHFVAVGGYDSTVAVSSLDATTWTVSK